MQSLRTRLDAQGVAATLLAAPTTADIRASLLRFGGGTSGLVALCGYAGDDSGDIFILGSDATPGDDLGLDGVSVRAFSRLGNAATATILLDLHPVGAADPALSAAATGWAHDATLPGTKRATVEQDAAAATLIDGAGSETAAPPSAAPSSAATPPAATPPATHAPSAPSPAPLPPRAAAPPTIAAHKAPAAAPLPSSATAGTVAPPTSPAAAEPAATRTHGTPAPAAPHGAAARKPAASVASPADTGATKTAAAGIGAIKPAAIKTGATKIGPARTGAAKSTTVRPATTTPATTTPATTGNALHKAAAHTAAAPADTTMIRRAQVSLLAHGLFYGRVTGVDGPATRAAIRHYQGMIGHTPTGLLTPDEMKLLTSG